MLKAQILKHRQGTGPLSQKKAHPATKSGFVKKIRTGLGGKPGQPAGFKRKAASTGLKNFGKSTL